MPNQNGLDPTLVEEVLRAGFAEGGRTGIRRSPPLLPARAPIVEPEPPKTA